MLRHNVGATTTSTNFVVRFLFKKDFPGFRGRVVADSRVVVGEEARRSCRLPLPPHRGVPEHAPPISIPAPARQRCGGPSSATAGALPTRCPAEAMSHVTAPAGPGAMLLPHALGEDDPFGIHGSRSCSTLRRCNGNPRTRPLPDASCPHTRIVSRRASERTACNHRVPARRRVPPPRRGWRGPTPRRSRG